MTDRTHANKQNITNSKLFLTKVINIISMYKHPFTKKVTTNFIYAFLICS